MSQRKDRQRRWSCDVCGRRVFRIEVSAAAIAGLRGWEVRFQALGACREHQPHVRDQIVRNLPASGVRHRAQLRPNMLAGWAASARHQLLAAAVADESQCSAGTRARAAAYQDLRRPAVEAAAATSAQRNGTCHGGPAFPTSSVPRQYARLDTLALLNTQHCLELPSQPTVVAEARHAVGGWCRNWDLTHLVDAAELLVSELVTNAVIHGLGAVNLIADFDGTRLRLEVHDHDPIPPRPHVTAAADLDEHGRGLQLIAMLADSWGSTRTYEGKAVWIELAAAGPAPLALR